MESCVRVCVCVQKLYLCHFINHKKNRANQKTTTNKLQSETSEKKKYSQTQTHTQTEKKLKFLIRKKNLRIYKNPRECKERIKATHRERESIW